MGRGDRKLARKLARTIPAVLAVTALMVVPSGARAATTIGETFTPGPGICPDRTHLQGESPGDQYAAPTDGVITIWSFQGSASPPPQLKFKVGRPAAGVQTFTMIGESGVVAPAAFILNSYFARIPVNAGDVIGGWTAAGGHCSRSQSGYMYFFLNGEVSPPTMAAFGGQGIDLQFDISAVLEPDCDKDGLGDETQDPDTASCRTPAAVAALTCKGQEATIIGTPEHDVRSGTAGRDVMVGQGGNDTLSGLAGNDLICGGPGKDTLKGGKGKDTLLGHKGKDTLKGGGGKDKCIGGKGNDTASKCEVEKSI